jgi:DNA-binding XRE family transcriptional regulator
LRQVAVRCSLLKIMAPQLFAGSERGEQLKMMRKDKGLTREQLAEEFGVSKHTVDKWEQDVNRIHDDVEKRLA